MVDKVLIHVKPDIYREEDAVHVIDPGGKDHGLDAKIVMIDPKGLTIIVTKIWMIFWWLWLW